MEELNVGNVVILNSGGPNMLVEKVTKKGNAKCIWVNDDGDICGMKFPIVCLTKKK